MGIPIYPTHLADRVAWLEARVKELMTTAASRIGYDKILAAALAVGQGDQRIELGPTGAVTLFGSGGTAKIHGGGGFLELRTVPSSGPFNAEIEMGANYARMEAIGTTPTTAEITTQVGQTPDRGTIDISITTPTGSTSDRIALLVTNGFVLIHTGQGIELPDLPADPPAPLYGTGVRLYAKNGRLYYRSAAGTIYGPLT